MDVVEVEAAGVAAAVAVGVGARGPYHPSLHLLDAKLLVILAPPLPAAPSAHSSLSFSSCCISVRVAWLPVHQYQEVTGLFLAATAAYHAAARLHGRLCRDLPHVWICASSQNWSTPDPCGLTAYCYHDQ